MSKENPQPDHDALVRLYGESMLRIGRLESEVARLADRLRGPESDQASGDEAAAEQQLGGLEELTKKVDSLQKLIMDSNGTASEPGSRPQPAAPDQRQDEISEMRLQIAGLASELTQAKDELAKARGNRRRRSSKGHRPWWKKLARRFGLSRSSLV